MAMPYITDKQRNADPKNAIRNRGRSKMPRRWLPARCVRRVAAGRAVLRQRGRKVVAAVASGG
jgi:hypothetical protein